MSTTTRDTLRAAIGFLTLAGFVGLTAAPTPAAPDGDAGNQEAEAYEATLEAIGESGVTGMVSVRRTGEELSVTVRARGLSTGTHPQHLHEGESCEEFGAVAVALDSDLGSAESGDFPAVEAKSRDVPATEGESTGSLTYQQTGSNADFADLDLANMTVVVHGSDGTPVACAELEPKDGGQGGGR